jgi:hypothetical protein
VQQTPFTDHLFHLPWSHVDHVTERCG